MWTPLLLALLAAPAQAQPLLLSPDQVVDPVLVPHEATATMAADGSFTLVLLPEQAWTQAELSIGGGGSVDLGPADGSAPVVIDGVVDQVGRLYLELATVSTDSHGVSWTFSVDPELLPVQSPELARGERSRRGFWPWQWGRQGGARR